MVSATAALSALTVAVLATTSSVDAHGTLVKPQLKFTGSGYGGNFAALVPMNRLTPQRGDIFTNYPDANKNAAAFERAFKASKYKTLKDFLLQNQDMSKGRSNMPKTPECGFTDPNSGPVQALPNQLEWYGGQMNHPGPCEVWCDNTVVLPFNGNCQKAYPNGKFNYNKAACQGKKRLTMYWMSTLLEWQVYIQCAKIGGGAARSMDDEDDFGVYNATAFDGQDEAEHENEENEQASLRAADESEDSVKETDNQDEARAAYEADNTNEILPSETEEEDYTNEILPTPSDEELAAQAEAQEAEDEIRSEEAQAAYEGY